MKITKPTTPPSTSNLASSLTLNKLPVTLGTIVTCWHGHRGHAYVIVGIDPVARKLYAIKNNCINQDQSIHKSTSGYHKVFTYNTLNIVNGVTTILGQKNSLDLAVLKNFSKTSQTTDLISAFSTTKLYANVLIDRRTASFYI